MSGGSASASGSGSGIRQAVERGVRTVLLYPRCACFMVPWLVYLLVANLFLSALLPLSALFPNAAYHASSACAAGVWLAIQRIFTRLNRARIVVSGVDALPPRESAIVVANHVGQFAHPSILLSLPPSIHSTRILPQNGATST
jgi:hypothetical protein